jgi:hypothetical protein
MQEGDSDRLSCFGDTDLTNKRMAGGNRLRGGNFVLPRTNRECVHTNMPPAAQTITRATVSKIATPSSPPLPPATKSNSAMSNSRISEAMFYSSFLFVKHAFAAMLRVTKVSG